MNGGFDLVLLDLMLPGIDGFTVCRRLREKLDIPILMVTARQEDIDKIRGLGLGADDYIEKPFSPSVLVARVKAHFSRYSRLTKSETPSTQIRLGGISVNTDTHRVFADDHDNGYKNEHSDRHEREDAEFFYSAQFTQPTVGAKIVFGIVAVLCVLLGIAYWLLIMFPLRGGSTNGVGLLSRIVSSAVYAFISSKDATASANGKPQ